jgi:hypothetical protein
MGWDVFPGRVRDEMAFVFLEETHEMGVLFLRGGSWDGMLFPERIRDGMGSCERIMGEVGPGFREDMG